MNNSNGPEKGFLSARVLNTVFISQVVINIIVLGLIIAGLVYALAQLNAQEARQEQITQTQIEIVQNQNNIQLCAQHDVILAVRKLDRGLERVLGLPPLANIDVPRVKGLDCEGLLAGR